MTTTATIIAACAAAVSTDHFRGNIVTVSRSQLGSRELTLATHGTPDATTQEGAKCHVVQVRNSELHGGVPKAPHAPHRVVLRCGSEHFSEQTVNPGAAKLVNLHHAGECLD